MRYALAGGGKRLRPGLVLLAAQACGAEDVDAFPAALAMEFIHTFSLVHDDLPAMDDDALRRGRPTLHVQTGEAMAILAGDAMVSFAFECTADAGYPDSIAAQLTRELASATTSMIVGQVHDTMGGFPHEITDEQRLQIIHRNKTGALIRAACRMGGIVAGAPLPVMTLLTTYGESLGLMFQAVDDLLDVESNAEQLGKATGKDAARGKLTYPGLHGPETTRTIIDELRGTCVDACTALNSLLPGVSNEPAGSLARLCEEMAIRVR